MKREAASTTERRPPARRAAVGVQALACSGDTLKRELQHAGPEAGALFIWFGVVVAVTVLFFFNPVEHGFFPACLFHKLTGWNCPGCGATRAAHELLHGNLAAAWRNNALLVCALPFCAWLAVRIFLRRRGGESRLPVFRPLALWISFAVVAGFAVLRNLPVGAWLAPV